MAKLYADKYGLDDFSDIVYEILQKQNPKDLDRLFESTQVQKSIRAQFQSLFDEDNAEDYEGLSPDAAIRALANSCAMNISMYGDD